MKSIDGDALSFSLLTNGRVVIALCVLSASNPPQPSRLLPLLHAVDDFARAEHPGREVRIILPVSASQFVQVHLDANCDVPDDSLSCTTVDDEALCDVLIDALPETTECLRGAAHEAH